MEYSAESLLKMFNSSSNDKSNISLLEEYITISDQHESALDEVETKLRVIDRELSSGSTIGRKNAIHQIQTRLKSLESIVKKLNKKQLNFSQEIIEENLSDVAGIRVICSYTDDIYLILESLANQDDVEVLRIKDYIANPKESGYRSLHAIVKIPVFFLDKTKTMKVEIQFRTIAMDYWASLEHGMRYKNQLNHSYLTDKLEKTSKKLIEIERDMLEVRQELERNYTVDE